MSDPHDPEAQGVLDYGGGSGEDPYREASAPNPQEADETGQLAGAAPGGGRPRRTYRHDPYASAGERSRPRTPGRGAGAHARAQARPRRRGGAHPVLVAIAAVIVVLVIAAAGFAYWVKRQVNPGGKLGAVVEVVIPKGASSSKIGSVLAADGIIHSGSLFRYYVRIEGAGTLYPGTYHLAKNESYSRAVAALEQGPPVVADKLVVPEGFTIAQIAVAVGKLPHADITAQQFLAAATGGEVRSPYEPAGSKDLEGLLFPATYTVDAGSGAVALVQQMVDAFDQSAASAGLAAGSAKLGLTPYQVVIVASMVEREASRAQDRGPVASVIYNRLHQNMPLGIDSTLLYGLHTDDPNVNPDTPSPYNTRIHTGLPPTPIASPGLASLEAALSPPATDYLYYAVTGPGGQTSFAATATQFAQIEAECEAGGYCSS